MPSTYSNLKIQLMATGENLATWGNTTNVNLGTALEEAIVGSANVTFASADVTLTLTDTNGTQPARNMRLNLTGATGGSVRNLIVPSTEKVYIVNNTCADSVVVKTSAGSGITVPAGKTMWVYNDGTNVVDATTHLSSLTLSTALATASGGTGANTVSGARVNLLPSYTSNAGKVLAVNTGATDVEWISVAGAGTVTSVNASGGSTGLTFTGGPITSAGTLTVGGTLAVASGGTGATTASGARTNLGASTVGSNIFTITNPSAVRFLQINADNTVSALDASSFRTAIGATGGGSVTSVDVSGGTTGLTFTGGPVTSSGTITAGGTLAVANGGTGATTASSARVNLLPSYGGNATRVLAVNSGATDVEWVTISGGSGTVTSVNANTTVSGLSFSGGPITTSGTLSLTGTVGVASGGTGATTLTSGAVLIGAGTSAITSVSPGTNGNVLTSNGSAWISSAPAASLSGITTSAITALGSNARTAVGTGGSAVFIGASAGVNFVNPNSVVAVGAGAMSNASGASSVAVGPSTLPSNSGSGVTAVGSGAGFANTSGGSNSFFGGNAGGSVTTGSQNTFIGYGAGSSLDTGANNTGLGFGAAPSTNTVSNEITLGNSSITTLRCQVTTITSLSDARDKDNIQLLDAGLEFIKAITPVRFTWNMRDGGRVGDEDIGFTAQDLKAAQDITGITVPGLVYESNPDKLEAGYGKLIPVLVNAILELSAKVEALEAQLGG